MKQSTKQTATGILFLFIALVMPLSATAQNTVVSSILLVESEAIETGDGQRFKVPKHRTHKHKAVEVSSASGVRGPATYDALMAIGYASLAEITVDKGVVTHIEILQ